MLGFTVPLTNGWSEYQRLVLAELERHNELIQNLDGKLNDIRVQIAMLQVKSGLWGAAAGLIPALLLLLMKVITP